jgi:hypothetical protein
MSKSRSSKSQSKSRSPNSQSGTENMQEILMKQFVEKHREIIGMSIKKYKVFYDMEKLLMEYVETEDGWAVGGKGWNKRGGGKKTKKKERREKARKRRKSNQRRRKTKKELIVGFLIRCAKLIKCGKSHFLGEIVNNYLSLKAINELNNLSQAIIDSKGRKSRVDIEEVSGGGGKIMNTLNSLLLTIIVSVITITTSNFNENVNNPEIMIETGMSINTNLKGKVNIEKGKIPPATPLFKGEFDPRSRGHNEEYAKMFGRSITFPEDRTIMSTNLKDFKENFIQKKWTQTLQLKPVQTYFTAFATDLFDGPRAYADKTRAEFSQQFAESIRGNLTPINRLVTDVYRSLEKTCGSFIGNVDDILPIEVWRIFNSDLAENVENDVFQERKEALRKQREEELIQKALKDIELNEGETIDASAITENEGWFQFVSGFIPKSFTTASTPKPLVVKNQKEVVNAILKKVSSEMVEGASERDAEVYMDISDEIYGSITNREEIQRNKRNRDRYFKNVCRFEPPEYKYSSTHGFIHISNPARARKHLTILAENVVSYYSKVKTGILSFDETGKITRDVPNADRIQILEVLYEKAHAIRDVMDSFDHEIITTLTDLPLTGHTLTELFDSINAAWNRLNQELTYAAKDLPITSKKQEREIALAISKFELMQEKDKAMFLIELKRRIDDHEMRRQENKMTKEENEQYTEWVQIYAKAMFGTVSTVVNEGTNAASNITETLTYKLQDNASAVGVLILTIVASIGIACVGACCLVVTTSGAVRNAVSNRMARAIFEDDQGNRFNAQGHRVPALRNGPNPIRIHNVNEITDRIRSLTIRDRAYSEEEQ